MTGTDGDPQPVITYALIHCERCGAHYAMPQEGGPVRYYCDPVTLNALWCAAESELRCPVPGCCGEIEVDTVQAVRTADGDWIALDFRWSAKVVRVFN